MSSALTTKTEELEQQIGFYEGRITALKAELEEHLDDLNEKVIPKAQAGEYEAVARLIDEGAYCLSKIVTAAATHNHNNITELAIEKGATNLELLTHFSPAGRRQNFLSQVYERAVINGNAAVMYKIAGYDSKITNRPEFSTALAAARKSLGLPLGNIIEHMENSDSQELKDLAADFKNDNISAAGFLDAVSQRNIPQQERDGR